MTDLSPVPLLEVEDLRTSFATQRGTLRAVDGVSFEVNAGETFGLVGESGSGKSILVRTIMGLLPRSALVGQGGYVHFDGRDLRAMDRTEARHFWGPEIAMVFQDPMTSLNPVKRIGRQITESMRYHLGLSKKAATDRAVELMREVGIPEPRRRLDQYPHELSGGMRQRVVIAIALSCEPRLLIADEPTTALDVTVQRQILDLLARLQAEHGMAMILISHDLGVVSGMSDHVAVMYAGQIVEQAPTATLFNAIAHPYTDALLASIPHLELESHTRLQAIGGRPPDTTAAPAGCRFAARCPQAHADCIERTIALAGGPAHRYRCLHPLTGGAQHPDGNRTAPNGAAVPEVAV